MGIGRSTFYDIPDVHARDLTIVAEMKTICDEFEAYGYRRVDAELRHRGIVVNTKKIRRWCTPHSVGGRCAVDKLHAVRIAFVADEQKPFLFELISLGLESVWLLR